jgi:hypothetical protein
VSVVAALGHESTPFNFVEATPNSVGLTVGECVGETLLCNGAGGANLLGACLAVVAFVFRLNADRRIERLGKCSLALGLTLPYEAPLDPLLVAA